MVDTLTVEQLLADSSPKVRSIAETLRTFVREAAPHAEEHANPGWKAITYSGKRLFIVIAPHNDTVDLVFQKGAMLEDPEKVLQGNGKGMRHIKVADPAQLRPEYIKSLAKQASGLAQ